MSIYDSTTTWTNGYVPYDSTSPDINGYLAMMDINRAVGYALFRPKTTSDTDYVELKHGGGSAKGIGKSTGKRKVTAGSYRSFLHELMHVLGFRHEQYHTSYPWVQPDFGTYVGKRGYMGKIAEFKDDKNKTMVKGLMKYAGWIREMQPFIDLKSGYLARTSQTGNVFSPKMDTNSIMMYTPYRSLIEHHKTEAILIGRVTNVQASPQVVGSCLTQADESGLKAAYTKPTNAGTFTLSLNDKANITSKASSESNWNIKAKILSSSW
ncbi:MAG: M12 family metallopeptidase [Planctomycetota bacterium]|jgi:hypothetical protein